MIEAVLLCPKLLVRHTWIGIDKELAERVVDLTFDHPRLDHRKYWRRHFLQNPIDKLLRTRTTIHSECINSTANGAAFEVLN